MFNSPSRLARLSEWRGRQGWVKASIDPRPFRYPIAPELPQWSACLLRPKISVEDEHAFDRHFIALPGGIHGVGDAGPSWLVATGADRQAAVYCSGRGPCAPSRSIGD